MTDPDEVWRSICQEDKSALIRLYLESHGGTWKPSITLYDIPEDILRLISQFFSRDVESFHNLAFTCKRFYRALGDYYMIADKSQFRLFVFRLVNRVNDRYTDNLIHISTRNVFDEKCRYICISTKTSEVAHIDKLSGLILSADSSYPRGHITDATPEHCFTNMGHLKSIVDMRALSPHFRGRYSEMNQCLKDASSSIISMKKGDKKRLYAERWNESNLRRKRFH